MNITNVAFVGLGVMGYPMAGYLAKAGYQTHVYNRTSTKAEAWEQHYSGKSYPTPKLAAEGCEVIFLCVGNDQDVRSVMYGDDGIIAGAKPGAIIVDHTTTSAELALELAQACREKGISFIDAPVSGGQAGAENGTLTIMCGGEADIFSQIQPVIANYAKQAELLGTHGQGQRCKMVNQICIAGVLQGLSEALQLAQAADLDIEQVVNVIKHGAAGSWQMENRAVTMSQNKFDFGFAIDWMRKDLGFCLNEAARHQIELPMTQEVDAMYAKLQDQGLGRMDTSVLIKAYDKTSI
ncbi:NAD(P)-dependent oxidoreductase [Vibrio gazogenes]|uniref:3-hydroxyisobutyrate dehydrogenase n=1 Tax=Vibrio gazogenes DSM 21264 = NBRC 103151 TaxID=1123492 RepID=A0A1M5AY33_VIBGA|nr:NAD(P)-dependent oxidoreductase [Vibrio gazogenes]USP12757.1 NAD(P)-dependent oxidoreductase [Vibrio gazogenes]SHF35113.1 3-hydroxyisobutyrate dehydrogenase [Vibrio gazogenes DSM 21264] [Vibrio gazogenes DSM 21264 = NBRC 103151]SJN57505.1 2-hydroxy-3-oxopropionate reductase [Vibrio gazogenes]